MGDSFHRFSGEHPRGAAQSLGRFAEDLRTRKLDGEACILRCVYLFICLFIVCLCACFLTIFKGLVVGSSINYVVLVHSHTLP